MNWRDLQPSADGTHHVRSGTAAYETRFDEVLAFHEPGLAPVRRGAEAWHIDPSGHPAYNERFDRTFGFYDGLAAVRRGESWFHVAPNGVAAYDGRFAWCGNFQEQRCPVRQEDGRYHHIDPMGAALYDSRWRYAGDFRGGVAVVQDDTGRSTHMDQRGQLLHDRWFFDLDVFHKGFARARDERGWTHVDRSGLPIYPRRFAMVEPFYNGQARVELDDGAIEVIDEEGTTLVRLRDARPTTEKTPFAALSADLVGIWRTRTIAAAVELGVFDALPASEAEIARKCTLAPARAPRLLHALAELTLIERRDDGWAATARGAFLARSARRTLADAALEYAGPLDQRWAALTTALRNERWSPSDVFDEVSHDAARVDGHHRMLASYAEHDYERVTPAMRLRGDEHVVDAGGGLGVLAQTLISAHPALTVTVLDRPEVVARAPNDTSAVRFVCCDLFSPWNTQADVIVLARVLHDWDDARAVAILRNARDSLKPGGRIIVLEMLLDESRVRGALTDLHLLVATGGRERTASDFAALFAASGLELREHSKATALTSVISGVAR